jgi:hypothetical protein
MKRRFILYRRKLGGTFYIEDTERQIASWRQAGALRMAN